MTNLLRDNRLWKTWGFAARVEPNLTGGFMHSITDEEKEFFDAAKELVRRYGVKDGRLIIFKPDQDLVEKRLMELVRLGKALEAQQ